MKHKTLEFERHEGPGLAARVKKYLERKFDLFTVMLWTANAVMACVVVLSFAVFVVFVLSLVPLEWG